MLRQRRTREGCSFTFRGSHTTSHDLVALPLEDEDGQPSPVLWCRWAPPARTVQRQAIHTSGSWSLVRPKDPFQQTEVTTQPGAYATKPDTTNAGDDATKEAGTSDGTKGNVGDKAKAPDGSVAGPPAKKRQAEQRAIPEGLSVKVVPGDGNCLYSSFAQGLAVATSKESVLHHLQLRAEVVQHSLKHADSYSPTVPSGIRRCRTAPRATPLRRTSRPSLNLVLGVAYSKFVPWLECMTAGSPLFPAHLLSLSSP